MSTKRQIEANRLNAHKSTGPNTVAGKEQSRKNSYKHGLAGDGVVVDEDTEKAIADRMVEWRSMFTFVDPLDEWHYTELVVNSVMLTRARRQESLLFGFHSDRARNHWDADRGIEAEELGARISRNPRLIVRKLATTPQGCDWLIERWGQILRVLENGGAWGDDHRRLFFDLAGIPHDVRDADDDTGSTPGCPDTIAFVSEQIADLQALREGSVARSDERERRAAVEGLPIKIPKPLFQILRYMAGFSSGFRGALEKLNKAGRYVIQKAPAPRIGTSARAPAPAPAPALASAPPPLPYLPHLPLLPPPPPMTRKSSDREMPFMGGSAAISPSPAIADLLGFGEDEIDLESHFSENRKARLARKKGKAQR